MTVEALAYESELNSKGYLSDIERGLARPTLQTLKILADRLDVSLLDLMTFPDADKRHALVDATRGLSRSAVERLLQAARSMRNE